MVAVGLARVEYACLMSPYTKRALQGSKLRAASSWVDAGGVGGGWLEKKLCSSDNIHVTHVQQERICILNVLKNNQHEIVPSCQVVVIIVMILCHGLLLPFFPC
jgi:hypothetical protein